MRIVVDLQGAQAESAKRGIGRYCMSFARGLARNRGEHEVLIALNGLFADSLEPLRAAFADLLPADAIRVWHGQSPVHALDDANHWRRRAAELTREAFLASLEPDMVVVASLFEGLVDDASTSIGTLGGAVPTATVLYDLIPWVHRETYLADHKVLDTWYGRKIDHLRRADLVLSISESSRQEGLRYLGLPEDRVVNISTAADPHFQPTAIDAKREAAVRGKYGLVRPFVMYTGGIDHRKNVEGLIRAYAKLGKAIRADHQLAIVCSIQDKARKELEALAREHKLEPDELVLTGFVPEEDLLALYNLCRAFVFPSWHEGFGLPALEAMACGRAVIAANASSLPEVVGRADALFEAKNDDAMTAMLAKVLTDAGFRKQLEQHGLQQAKKFSWDATARTALQAIERWHARYGAERLASIPATRPRLAYVSPLPPERSGISDYSSELLPELARHYDIEVIIDQEAISDSWIRASYPARTTEYLRTHPERYDRVMYHFGNSQFHQHMFDLLAEVPGVVVLHDFFLSGIAAHMDVHALRDDGWPRALYESHGYGAMQRRYTAKDSADVVWAYPCNLRVLRDALGVIVHSENSRRLARQWYGPEAADGWAVIPHLRTPAVDLKRADARKALDLPEGDFVVCSFGLLGRTKLNHRLLDAWLASPLAKDKRCRLVFVGQNDTGDYGAALTDKIAKSGVGSRIRIAGWTDTGVFRQYLEAADVGVQLRTLSRGETSGTVLDCMNHGLATIVNAHGSMADLPDEGVWKLADDFTDADLVAALETLWSDRERREALGRAARDIVIERHAPRHCASQYASAIERIYAKAATSVPSLAAAIAAIEPAPDDPEAWGAVADAIGRSIAPRPALRQLLVDVSELVHRDVRTGIQRVVRSILQEMLQNPPEGYRVEPVYATAHEGYRYARAFTLRMLGIPDTLLRDDFIEYRTGDVFLGLDLQPHVVPAQAAAYQAMRRQGVRVVFVAYDLLPIKLPHAFVPGAGELHQRWLEITAAADGIACISESVAADLVEWLPSSGVTRVRPLSVGHFHLGADIEASNPTKGLPDDAQAVLEALGARPTFLMVGTIEPRKRHDQALAAFEALWDKGVAANLAIVGKQGWMVEPLVERLRAHPELGKRLFWLESVSDEYLERIYAASACLVAASEGEGFGLPLVEAAQRGLAVLARDIPVFREVAGSHASYFAGTDGKDLAREIGGWLALHRAGKAPKSGGMPRLTWAQSAKELLAVALGGRWKSAWMSDGGHRYRGSSPKLATRIGKREGSTVRTTGEAGYLVFGPYIALPAGRYSARIYGELKRAGTPPAFADLASVSGTVVHGRSDLAAGPGGLLANLELVLDTPVTDIEARVWVAADADLRITRLDILPAALVVEEKEAQDQAPPAAAKGQRAPSPRKATTR